jgi:hypothetical protein
MAVTITLEALAVSLGIVGTATDTIPDETRAELQRLLTLAGAQVTAFAPDAPDAAHDEAVVRLCGWLYDTDPAAGQRGADPLSLSGAAGVLSRWRLQRLVGAGAVAPGPAPGPAGPGVDPQARATAALAESTATDALNKANQALDDIAELLPLISAAALPQATEREADQATGTGFRAWSAALLHRLVDAVVPDWALSDNPPGGGFIPAVPQDGLDHTLQARHRGGDLQPVKFWATPNYVPDTPGTQSGIGHVLTVTGENDGDYRWQEAQGGSGRGQTRAQVDARINLLVADPAKASNTDPWPAGKTFEPLFKGAGDTAIPAGAQTFAVDTGTSSTTETIRASSTFAVTAGQVRGTGPSVRASYAVTGRILAGAEPEKVEILLTYPDGTVQAQTIQQGDIRADTGPLEFRISASGAYRWGVRIRAAERFRASIAISAVSVHHTDPPADAPIDARIDLKQRQVFDDIADLIQSIDAKADPLTQQQQIGLLRFAPAIPVFRYASQAALKRTYQVRVSNPQLLQDDIWFERRILAGPIAGRIKWTDSTNSIDFPLTSDAQVLAALDDPFFNLEIRFYDSASAGNEIDRILVSQGVAMTGGGGITRLALDVTLVNARYVAAPVTGITRGSRNAAVLRFSNGAIGLVTGAQMAVRGSLSAPEGVPNVRAGDTLGTGGSQNRGPEIAGDGDSFDVYLARTGNDMALGAHISGRGTIKLVEAIVING